MNAFKHTLLLLALSSLTTLAFAVDKTANPNPSPSADASFLGKYACKGHNPYDNSDYSMLLEVTKTGDTYTFTWTDSNGYPVEYGTGVTNPSLPNMIAIIFWNGKDTERKGIVLYESTADGLKGTWTYKTESKSGTESCTRQK